MFKLLQIFLFLGFSVAFSQASLDNFKITTPEFVPKGKSFEAAIVTSRVFKDARHLNIYIVPGSSLFLSSAELWTKENKSVLDVSSVFVKKFSKSAYLFSIDFTNTHLLERGTFFQIILKFGAVNLKESGYKIYGEFSNANEVLGYLKIGDRIYQTNEENLYKFNLKTYEMYEIAGESASFGANSFFEIPLKFKTENDIVLDFWIKQQSFDKQIFKLIDKQNNRTECVFEVNEYQMLRSKSDFHEQISLKPQFVSKSIWYHINLRISNAEPYIYFYCNGDEISKFKLQNELNTTNLSLKFLNDSNVSSFNIDQLRLFETSGTMKPIFQNRNYKDFTSDSTFLLFQINFKKAELSSVVGSDNAAYSNIRLVKSDAPIFPRAPEINLKIRNNFYEIEWTGGDYSKVNKYIIERAIGNEDFAEIAEQNADTKASKVYSYISDKIDKPEIIYFRIKQVNLDKTEVYSEMVKVGQGLVEDIVLEQNYPNPFNPETQIEFELLQESDVEVVVYNMAGKEVALLHNGFLSKGIYQFEFDGSEMPSGIYFYQVTTSQSTQTRKMILTK